MKTVQHPKHPVHISRRFTASIWIICKNCEYLIKHKKKIISLCTIIFLQKTNIHKEDWIIKCSKIMYLESKAKHTSGNFALLQPLLQQCTWITWLLFYLKQHLRLRNTSLLQLIWYIHSLNTTPQHCITGWSFCVFTASSVIRSSTDATITSRFGVFLNNSCCTCCLYRSLSICARGPHTAGPFLLFRT